MTRTHIVNMIDGREVPSLVVTKDYSQIGTHKGAIIVEGGHTTACATGAPTENFNDFVG